MNCRLENRVDTLLDLRGGWELRSNGKVWAEPDMYCPSMAFKKGQLEFIK
jgi:hypothetical protein